MLRDRGHVVYEQTLTGMGDRSHLATRRVNLTTHVEDVINTIHYADERNVILVAHSYAGFVATCVADRIPRAISHLIYLDANIPRGNGSSMFGDFRTSDRRSYMEMARKRGEGWKLPVMRETGSPAFDLSQYDLKMMHSLGTPQPIRTYTERVSLRGDYKKVRRTFIKCEWETNPFDVNALRNDGMNVVTIRSGHWPMLSCPSSLARVLDECAGQDLERRL